MPLLSEKGFLCSAWYRLADVWREPSLATLEGRRSRLVIEARDWSNRHRQELSPDQFKLWRDNLPSSTIVTTDQGENVTLDTDAGLDRLAKIIKQEKRFNVRINPSDILMGELEDLLDLGRGVPETAIKLAAAQEREPTASPPENWQVTLWPTGSARLIRSGVDYAPARFDELNAAIKHARLEMAPSTNS
jgi:translation initiation factor IF-1